MRLVGRFGPDCYTAGVGYWFFHRDIQWAIWQGVLPIVGNLLIYWFVGQLQKLTANTGSSVKWPAVKDLIDPIGWVTVAVLSSGSAVFSAIQLLIRRGAAEIGVAQLIISGVLLFGSGAVQISVISAKVTVEQGGASYRPARRFVWLSLGLAIAAVVLGGYSNATLNPVASSTNSLTPSSATP